MKKIFKKASLGLVSSLMSFGMCFAGGPGDIPEKVEVKILTESDCYKEYVSGEEHKIKAEGVMIRMFKTPEDGWFNYYNRTGQMPSVHGCVGSNGVIIFLPTNTRGWHCAGTCNDTHFSFMLCEPNGLVYADENKSRISTKFEDIEDNQKEEFENVWNNSVWLTAVYCYKFGFKVTDDTVLGHCEAYNKTPVADRNIRSKRLAGNMATPEHVFSLFDKSMNKFREDVSVLLDNWNKNGISKELEEKINFIFNELEKYTYR